MKAQKPYNPAHDPLIRKARELIGLSRELIARTEQLLEQAHERRNGKSQPSSKEPSTQL
jgi:hypothetical protein